jgi:uncharacterized membrane protein YczE
VPTPTASARSGVPRRLIQLYLGLVLYAVSMALFIRGDCGVMPWDVLHQGLVYTLAVTSWAPTLGEVAIVVGAVVLLAWIPLRQRPGLGTISNVVVIGVAIDVLLAAVPQLPNLAVRVVFMLLGVLTNAVASALYIGARFGAGPRDGLMTGLAARTGWKIRWVRTGIEVTVVVAGWLLHGGLGVGTVLYALTIGPLVHPLLPWLTVADERDTPPA